MESPDCWKFSERFSSVTSLEEIHGTLAEACEDFGFDHFLYAARLPTSLTEPAIVVLSGYPPEWRQRYTEREYCRIDPTVAHCLRSTLPLLWRELSPILEEDAPRRQFMEEAGEFGLRDGLSIPVHTPRGESGILSFAWTSLRTEIAPLLPSLLFLSAHAHEALLRLVEVREISPPPPELTPRERECLRWAAEGKTSWEMACILRISERTAIFHLQNAAAKLQTNSRQQAVARALSLGLLTADF